MPFPLETNIYINYTINGRYCYIQDTAHSDHYTEYQHVNESAAVFFMIM